MSGDDVILERGLPAAPSVVPAGGTATASTNVESGLWQRGQQLDHAAPFERPAGTSGAVSALALESSLARNLGCNDGSFGVKVAFTGRGGGVGFA